MTHSQNNPRVLTIIEGREENKQITEDLGIAATNRGWKIFNLKEINSDKLARIDFNNIPLDFILFRDLTYNNYVETERLLDYLKNNRKIGVNLDAAGGRASTSDKHYQQGLFLLDPFLKDYALPTFEAKHKANVMSYINGDRVSFPIVLKYRFGTTGKDITLVHNETELDQIKSFNGLLIEQYIEADHDWRVFVMGGTAIGIMKKSGDPKHPEDFKAWSAGRTKLKETDQDTIEILSKIACKAAAVQKLEYTGVDIIQDKHTKKFYVLETNFAAGWLNHFIPTTGINIPDVILDWFEERDNAKHQTIDQSVKQYINNRKKYLSRETLKNYEAILAGEKGITDKIKTQFKHEKAKYLYDTGYLFNQLAAAYEDIVDGGDATKYSGLIDSIEHMPLSWTGNFIGPECGTLEDGAILSALYLYILGKMRKV